MNVSLTPELTQFVKSQAESGMYASDSEVIRHGLRLLVDLHAERQRKIVALDAAIREGLETPLKTWNKEGFLEKMKNKNK